LLQTLDRTRFPIFALVSHVEFHAKVAPEIEQTDDPPMAMQEVIDAVAGGIDGSSGKPGHRNKISKSATDQGVCANHRQFNAAALQQPC